MIRFAKLRFFLRKKRNNFLKGFYIAKCYSRERQYSLALRKTMNYCTSSETVENPKFWYAADSIIKSNNFQGL